MNQQQLMNIVNAANKKKANNGKKYNSKNKNKGNQPAKYPKKEIHSYQRNSNFQEKKKEQQPINTAKAVAKNQYRARSDGDFRFATSTDDLQFKTQSHYTNLGISVNPELNNKALSGVAAAFVSKALSTGFYDTRFPDDALNAGDFILQSLVAAAANSTPTSTTLPAWLQIICELIKPKRVRDKSQVFDYSFNNVSADSFASVQEYSLANTSASLNYGVISTDTNKYSYNTILPGTLSADMSVKAQAFNRLSQHLYSVSSKRTKELHQALTPETLKKVKYCAAAYSCPTITSGTAYGSTGGDIVRLGNEVSTTPAIAGFFARAASSFAASGRAPNYNASRGGGAMEACFFFLEYPFEVLKDIEKPVIKYVDMGEFFHVYCRTLTRAIQLMLNKSDSILVESVTSRGQALLDTLLPKIDFQSAYIAFRNFMMLAFSPTQWAFQSMSSGTAAPADYVGLSCSVGTHPVVTSTPMLIPGYLMENVRANLLRQTSTVDGKKRFAITDLVVRPSQIWNMDDYSVDYQNGSGTQRVCIFDKLVDAKPPINPVKSPSVYNNKKLKDSELYINIWDGSSNGDGFAQLNEQSRLARNVNALNKCVTACSEFIESRSTFSTAPSDNALTQVGLTNFYQPIDVTLKGFGRDLAIFATSYSYAPQEAIVEGVPFIGPCFVEIPNSDGTYPTFLQKASDSKESYLNLQTAPGQQVRLVDRLESIVENCVGAKNSNVVKTIDRLSKDGKGGILSSLLGAVSPVLPLAASGLDSFLGL